MPTDKSTLMFDDVINLLQGVNVDTDRILFPLGLTPGGKLETVEASNYCGINHLYLYGPDISERDRALDFILNGLLAMYPEIYLKYLSMHRDRARKWMRHPTKVVGTALNLAEVTNLESVLCVCCTQLRDKKDMTPEVIVLDDMQDVLMNMSPVGQSYLSELIHWGPERNVQLVYSTQYKQHPMDILKEFQIYAYTHVSPADVKEIFGDDIEKTKGGIKYCGELIYTYDGTTSKVRVPICPDVQVAT